MNQSILNFIDKLIYNFNSLSFWQLHLMTTVLYCNDYKEEVGHANFL
jgi:hypothetical protein